MTTPPETVACAISELSHAPPGMLLVSVMVEPVQTSDGPRLGTVGLIVTVVSVRQPVGRAYVILQAPMPTPYTLPVLLFTLARLFEEVQTPPAIALDSRVLPPGHIVLTPAIAAGDA